MKSAIVAAVLSSILLSACNQDVAEPAAQASRPDAPSLQAVQDVNQAPVFFEKAEAPLTREQKIANVENYFGALRANFALALGTHDAVLKRVKIDVQDENITAARKHARMLIDMLQSQQANVVMIDVLYDHGDITPALLDDLDITANAIFGELVSSAAGLASAVDVGIGENESDLKNAERSFIKLKKLMFRIYAIYGYSPTQIDDNTWRLKVNNTSK